MKKTYLAALILGLFVPIGITAQAHDRREAAIAASSQVQAIAGGTTVQVPGSYAAVFEGLVTYLKKSGYAIDDANKESGLVATSMEISGGWKQTGKRFIFSVIDDKKDSTAIRVAASIQKRYKGLQTEPWGDPKVDDKASAELAAKVKAELPAQIAQSS